MSSSSMPSHFAPASSRSCKYDVFLSFRGDDIRKTFVDHFYSALEDRQIHTYKDDITLPRGESISQSLFKAVEQSRIAVVIFSKNYADSSWCLEELAYIMKERDERGFIVMPIFYDVNPSEVRKQIGDFGKAFAKQEVEYTSKAGLWRKALVDASEIAGWEPKNIANGHESKVIKEIIDEILERLFCLKSNVDEALVGMDTRLQDLKSRLKIGSGGVRMVGIWGIGGSGKTTLAYSLYKEIFDHFQGHCIVDDIRVESSKHGLKTLQEKILLGILKTHRLVQSVEEGKDMIKSRLCESNVLLLLDDVNDLNQLEALIGNHNWFGNGSRIVITTRDEHLLRSHNVDEVCHVKLLSDNEAIRLFNRHAFKQNNPTKGYETISLSVVSYAAGLPLAVKVLGTFLCDKHINEWISALNKLKDIPDLKVMDILKISYDGLETYQKELFLDIACFWRRRSTSDAMEIFEACKLYPQIGIEVLRQKALITIVDGRFDMHDLIQEMGHYIVRGEHPNNPEEHSRVWKDEEIINMVYEEATQENDKIQAIRYNGYSRGHEHYSSRFCKMVSNLKKLRWLSVYLNHDNYENAEGPTFLSNELRHIEWYGYPPSSLPENFQPVKLVVLVLRFSMQKELWKGCKRLPHLKMLQLEFMDKLISFPDLNGLPRLQKLIIGHCYKLKEVHPSLGNHTSLEYVKVHSCPELKRFPTIVHMKNLNALKIESCQKILELPEIQENLENLVKLSLKSIGIEVLPSSIGERCTNLISIHLSQLDNLKSIQFNFDSLKHLIKLKFEGLIQLGKTRHQSFHKFLGSIRKLDLSRSKDVAIPSSIGELSKLQVLNLSRNDFSRLDFSLSQLTWLKLLNVSRCKHLLELPKLPSNLAILIADYCKSLASIGDFHTNCKWLCQVSLTGGSIIHNGGRLLQSMLEGKAIENGYMILQLEGIDIPKGFTPSLTRGCIHRLQLPENWCRDFSGFLMCAVFINKYFWTCRSSVEISINEVTGGIDSQDDVVLEESNSDLKTWVGYVSFGLLRHNTWWDQTYKAISFAIEDKYNHCVGFGVRLVAKRSTSGLTKLSTHSSSAYTSNFKIEHDSKSNLVISFK